MLLFVKNVAFLGNKNIRKSVLQKRLQYTLNIISSPAPKGFPFSWIPGTRRCRRDAHGRGRGSPRCVYYRLLLF